MQDPKVMRKGRNKGKKPGKAGALRDKSLLTQFRRAARASDPEALSALIREHLADPPATAAVWADLATLYRPSPPKDMETGLAVCLGAILDDKDGPALRALVRSAVVPEATDAELAAWAGLRNALAAEGDLGQDGLRQACQWVLTTRTARRWPKLRLRVMEWQAGDAPQDPAAQWAIVGELARGGEAAAAWAEFDRLVKARIKPPDEDLRTVSALARLPKDDILSRLSIIGRRGWKSFRMRLVNAAARKLPIAQELLRRPLVTRSKEPFVISEDGGAGVTAIVFNGRERMLGAPFAQIDAKLAERGIRTIHLFDDTGSAYISGAAGQPSAEAAFEFLLLLARQTPGNRLITLGNSMSAIAACAYGLNMRVDGVIGLASATTGTATERALIGDRRAGDFALKAEGLAGEETDLRTWFRRIPHRPIVHLHYAAGLKVDKAHAERLAEFEGVSLFEAEGHYVHSLPSEMLLRGTLGPAIDRMLAALRV